MIENIYHILCMFKARQIICYTQRCGNYCVDVWEGLFALQAFSYSFVLYSSTLTECANTSLRLALAVAGYKMFICCSWLSYDYLLLDLSLLKLYPKPANCSFKKIINKDVNSGSFYPLTDYCHCVSILLQAIQFEDLLPQQCVVMQKWTSYITTVCKLFIIKCHKWSMS